MSDQAHARRMAADAALARGDYPAALEGFLWFHRHALAIDPELRGVRLSYALADWSRLAALYPPAAEAFRGTLSQATADALDQSKPDAERVQAFKDAAALNKQIEDGVATVVLYRSLVLNAPQVADQCNGAAFEAVADSGDVALARRSMDDPEVIIRGLAEWLTVIVHAKVPAKHAEVAARRRPGQANRYAAEVDRVCRVLAGSGDAGQVPEIRQLACDLAPELIRTHVQAALGLK